MLRFLLGFVFAILAVIAAVLWYFNQHAYKPEGCLGVCGPGTYCKTDHCLPSQAVVSTAPDTKPSRRRHGHGTGGAGGNAEPEKKLQPGDERSGSAGDALGRPEHIDMTSGGDEKELSQDDIDRTWRSAEPQLSHCITEAVADWPLESGKIEVSYRIERDGGVKKVRLIAPQLLLRNGLYACMRGKITALRFPRSGGASVVTFPFQLQ